MFYKIIILFVLIIINNKIFSQDLCIKIDSIVVNYIPINVNTTLSLDDYDILNFNKEYRYKKVITDTTKIQTFSKINLFNNKNKNLTSIDVRLVIRVYSNEINIINVSMDKFFNYKIKNKIFLKSDELLNWIRTLNLKDVGIITE